MVKYKIKLTIPTTSYGNIQPEVEVEANSIEEAHAMVSDWVESMYDIYLNKVPSNVNKKVVTSEQPNTTENTTTDNTKKVFKVDEHLTRISNGEIASTPAFKSALLNISATSNSDTLSEIIERIKKSEKLAPEEKTKLIEYAAEKITT